MRLALLLAIAVALSGCSGSSGDGGDPVVDDFRDKFESQGQGGADAGGEAPGDSGDDFGPDAGGSDGATGVSGSDGDNVLAVELAASNTTGRAPFEVDFRLNATAIYGNGSIVKDFSDFEWGLFSENASVGLEISGKGFPATISFTFPEGTHTIVGAAKGPGFDEAFAQLEVEVAPAPVPALYPYSCTTDISSFLFNGSPYFGCGLTTAQADAVLSSIDPSDCIVQVTEPGETGGTVIAVGDAIPAGWDVDGYCSITAVGTTITIELLMAL